VSGDDSRLYRLAVCLHLRRPESPDVKRFREIQELHELGVAMRRQRMRNENPDATEPELDAMVWAWLQEPPRPQFLTRPPSPPKDNDDDH
jgi:hypothetical protein